jgi:hypothetical protein
VDKRRREHPGEEIPDGHVFTQPWAAEPLSRRRDQVIYQAPVKRNRFIRLDSAAKSVNRELEAKAGTLPWIRARSSTSPPAPTARP